MITHNSLFHQAANPGLSHHAPLPRDGGIVTEGTNLPSTPRIYYINGIRTTPQDHLASLRTLTEITERQVHGIYNATHGMPEDLLQCLDDWLDVARVKLLEQGIARANELLNRITQVWPLRYLGETESINLAESLRQRIPTHLRISFLQHYFRQRNPATATLFNQLLQHRQQRQFLVAHSQGNLITANALWGMVLVHGQESLRNMVVFSLASPTPAWPVGIRHRRKVYGYFNDLVPQLCDPHNWTFVTKHFRKGRHGRTDGDWRQHAASERLSLSPHPFAEHMALNFAETLRRMIGL